MPAALHACPRRQTPCQLSHPHPQCSEGWGAGASETPVSAFRMVSKGVSGVGGPEIRSWGRAGGDTRSQLIITVWVSLFQFPPTPSLFPDTLPVFRPGHQPDHPTSWASGPSVSGTWPAWLPTPPAPVSGQTWTADILFPREHVGRDGVPRSAATRPRVGLQLLMGGLLLALEMDSATQGAS